MRGGILLTEKERSNINYIEKEVTRYINSLLHGKTNANKVLPEYIKNRLVIIADLLNKRKQKKKMLSMAYQEKNGQTSMKMVETLKTEIEQLNAMIIEFSQNLHSPETQEEKNAQTARKAKGNADTLSQEEIQSIQDASQNPPSSKSWINRLFPTSFAPTMGGKRSKKRRTHRKH